MLRFAMRIVARHAADARVYGVITFAVGQAVGLEAYVIDVVRSLRRNLRPRAVALPAEIGYLLSPLRSQLAHRRLSKIAGLESRHMLLRGAVAAFALHTL